MVGPGSSTEVASLPPKKDFPSQASLLGDLGNNYSPYGVAAGQKPFNSSLFCYPGGITVKDVNRLADYSFVGTGDEVLMTPSSAISLGRLAAVTSSGNTLIVDNRNRGIEIQPSTDLGSPSRVREFPLYPEERFSNPQEINQLAISPINDAHLFVAFVPMDHRGFPNQVSFVDTTDESKPKFTDVHFFPHERIVDFAAGQDREGSELVAVVSEGVEKQNTALQIFDTKGKEIINIKDVTTVIAGGAGEFFYMNQLGKVYSLKNEDAPPSWQKKPVFDPNKTRGEPLFLTKAPDGKVVVVTRSGQVFLVDPQKPEKNGLPGTHYQLPETSETGKPLILCEAAATMDGGTAYAVMREGSSAVDANYLLYKLYDLIPEPPPVEPPAAEVPSLE